MGNWRIIIITQIGIIIFLLLFLYYGNLDITIEKSSYILKILFSYITLIIALKIYDRFGLNKKITEKRTELIVDLLIELKKIYFRVDTIQEACGRNSPFFPKKDISKFLDFFEEKELEYKILFLIGEKDEFLKKIETIENNPLLPKSIKEKLYFLTTKGGAHPKENVDSYKAKIYFTKKGAEKIYDEKSWLMEWGNDCTLKEYINKFRELFEEIESWIKKHSNLSDELNI